MRTLPVIAALVATLVLAAPAGAAVKRLEANLKGSSATDTDGISVLVSTSSFSVTGATLRVTVTLWEIP